MKVFSNNNFVVIDRKQAQKHNLSGNDLLFYSLISGFGKLSFYGSQKYIEEFFNLLNKTVHNVLQRLLKRNLITKIKRKNSCIYLQKDTELDNSNLGDKNSKLPDNQNFQPYNGKNYNHQNVKISEAYVKITDNNIINNIEDKKRELSQFLKFLGFIENNCPKLNAMQTKITPKQFKELSQKYPPQEIKFAILDFENQRKTGSYCNQYITILQNLIRRNPDE